MKKWMKGLAVAMLAALTLITVSAKDVYADGDDVRSIIDVEYDGDPVPYGSEIKKGDIIVTVRYEDGSRGTLKSSEFEISPDTMESTRSERVTVTVYGVDGRELTEKIGVDCAKPKLDYIEVEYKGDEDLPVGAEIDEDDVIVEAFYDDDTSEYVTDWEFKKYNIEEGRNTITVVYEEGDEEEEEDFDVWGYEAELVEISASYSGGSVIVGKEINKAYIKVEGVYEENDKRVATQTLTGWYLRGYTIKEGNNTITVYYSEDGDVFEDTIQVKGVKASAATNTNVVTGWEAVSGRWRYKENGIYAANKWVNDGGKWYWIEPDGYMAANKWFNDAGTWYWLNADGSMATGWIVVGGQWYFMDEINGNMRVGWKWWNGQCYYLDPISGAMATNRWIGNWYVDGSGAWTQTR